jgi:hypothetical protein
MFPRRNKKPVSRPRFFLMLGGLVALVVGCFLLIEAAFTPWARSITGGPTLTGEWMGEIRTASGRQILLWMKLEHFIPTDQCADCPALEGRARTCEANGEQREYRLWGDVENWRGTVFYVKTLDESEHAGKLTLGTLDGKWSGDTMELSTELRVAGAPTTMRFERAPDGRETTRVIGGDPDTHAVTRWNMQRGNEQAFLKKCGDST